MSSAAAAADTDTSAPLLSPSGGDGARSFRSRSQRFSRRAGLRGAARFLRGTNSRGMISEQSVRVREVAAQQIEERQSDWAYSTPIVVLDLLWNTIFVFVGIVMLILSNDEVTKVPLRLWLVGYGVQCILHMICVYVEYNRRREMNQVRHGGWSAAAASSSGWSVGAGISNMDSSLSLNLNLGSNRSSYSNSRSNSSSSVSDVGDLAQFAPERRVDEDNTSVAKHLESANTMFSFIWWIIGFYWVSSGGEELADAAPKLYWLTITFLAFDVFFVVICVTVACIIGIAVCCCLPCIIALLYAVADQDGATREDIDRMPRYKFRRIGEVEKQSGEIQESFGGIMTECETDSPIEHVLSREDAECCICLSSYDDGNELRELPCQHHFHSSCIDKWLYINATCPLCKYNILKNGNQSCEDM